MIPTSQSLSLFTTLSPKQYSSINTIIANLKSHSCNLFLLQTTSEAAIIQRHHSSIRISTFDPANPTISHPSLYDLFLSFASVKTPYIGYVNADIILSHRFFQYIESSCNPGKVTFFHRLDIHSDGSSSYYNLGLDSFVFARNALPDPTPASFKLYHLGKPAWDYYLPLLFTRLNYDISFAKVPYLLHHAHHSSASASLASYQLQFSLHLFFPYHLIPIYRIRICHSAVHPISTILSHLIIKPFTYLLVGLNLYL